MLKFVPVHNSGPADAVSAETFELAKARLVGDRELPAQLLSAEGEKDRRIFPVADEIVE